MANRLIESPLAQAFALRAGIDPEEFTRMLTIRVDTILAGKKETRPSEFTEDLACYVAREMLMGNEHVANAMPFAMSMMLCLLHYKQGTTLEWRTARDLLLDWLCLAWVNDIEKDNGRPMITARTLGWRDFGPAVREAHGFFPGVIDIRLAFLGHKARSPRQRPQAAHIANIMAEMRGVRDQEMPRALYEKLRASRGAKIIRFGKTGG